MTILPKIIDRYRTKRNGERRYVGQIVLIDGTKKKEQVIAEVYGDTLKEMRGRKYAVLAALKALAKGKK